MVFLEELGNCRVGNLVHLASARLTLGPLSREDGGRVKIPKQTKKNKVTRKLGVGLWLETQQDFI